MGTAIRYAHVIARINSACHRGGYLICRAGCLRPRRSSNNCTFAEMKKHGDELMPQLKMILKGAGDSFFHKGTNGRWCDVLSVDELRLYDAAAARELTPDCRRWLENGKRAAA